MQELSPTMMFVIKKVWDAEQTGIPITSAELLLDMQKVFPITPLEFIILIEGLNTLIVNNWEVSDGEYIKCLRTDGNFSDTVYNIVNVYIASVIKDNVIAQ